MALDMTSEFRGVNIKVIGVGGGGGNAVNRMIKQNIKSVEFVVINTDVQDLDKSTAATKLQIGEKITRGKGVGADPEKGMAAAVDAKDEISSVLKGADMVFITCGMGGGTGTGASPVIAEIARDMGILTVGVVTKPFEFEGHKRMQQADEGISLLKDKVDSLLVIPNERLKLLPDQHITLFNAFDCANQVLAEAVQNISEIINVQAVINLDFEDVKAVMKDSGISHLGVGSATGKDKTVIAAEAAIASPLMGTSIEGAKGILLNFTASSDIGLDEVDLAASKVRAAVNKEANIIWGVALDENLVDEVRITVIATRFDEADQVDLTKPEAETPDEDFDDILSMFSK